jgi:hypothetical protein
VSLRQGRARRTSAGAGWARSEQGNATPARVRPGPKLGGRIARRGHGREPDSGDTADSESGDTAR